MYSDYLVRWQHTALQTQPKEIWLEIEISREHRRLHSRGRSCSDVRQSDKSGRLKRKLGEERNPKIATEMDNIMPLSLWYDEVCKDIPAGCHSQDFLSAVICGHQILCFVSTQQVLHITSWITITRAVSTQRVHGARDQGPRPEPPPKLMSIKPRKTRTSYLDFKKILDEVYVLFKKSISDQIPLKIMHLAKQLSFCFRK